MKTICAMQPYVFPYLPYYQLAEAVDEFWVLDDVQFIRRSWMTRNHILLNGQKHRISFPVTHGRQNDLIRDKTLPDSFDEDLRRLAGTLTHAYGKAPHAARLTTLLAALLHRSWKHYLEFAIETLHQSFACLGLSTPLFLSSSLNLHADLRGVERILKICACTGATRYVNPEGGRALYNSAEFAARGVDLRFLHGRMHPYSQPGHAPFEPGLSILDPIAHLSSEELAHQLGNHTLIKA